MKVFKTILFFNLGFGQDWRESSGIEQIWAMVAHVENDPDTLVLPPFEWDRDTEEVAKLIVRHSDADTKIGGNAYSWGVGQAFVNLCRDLWRYGNRRVRDCVLCDGVYRSRILPTWLPANVLSLLRFPKITIPHNVDRVRWVRQRSTTPAGHDLVAEGPDTRIDEPILIRTSHNAIDDTLTHQSMVIDMVQSLVGRKLEIA